MRTMKKTIKPKYFRELAAISEASRYAFDKPKSISVTLNKIIDLGLIAARKMQIDDIYGSSEGEGK